MAKTQYATGNNLTRKAWSEKIWRDSKKESYFVSRFFGQNSNSIVHEKVELEKKKGDKVTFGIRMRLSGAGVTSGQTLEGNEEPLTTYDSYVSLEQYRHAVRDEGEMDRQRVTFSIDEESKLALQDWGSEKTDQLCFDALDLSPTRIAYPGASSAFNITATESTAKAALDTTNTYITPTFISQLKTWAKTGGNRTIVPLRPVKVDGDEFFVLLVPNDVMTDLKINSTFAQAMREAQNRGKDNPLFKNAVAIWDGVVIHEHENVTVGTDAGASSNVPYGKCHLLGAQALCFAWGKRGKLVYKEFDYEDEHGYAWGIIGGCRKPIFNSLDHGSVCAYLTRHQISDKALS